MSDLRLYEVRLVRAPKDKVWKEVADLKKDPNADEVKVKGAGKGATRTLTMGKTTREEKVADLKEKERIVFDLKDDKAEGRVEVLVEDHELGTMVVQRAELDVKGMKLFSKGRYKKELQARADWIQENLES